MQVLFVTVKPQLIQFIWVMVLPFDLVLLVALEFPSCHRINNHERSNIYLTQIQEQLLL